MLFIIQLNSVIMYLLMGAVVASAAIKATGPNASDFLSYIDAIAIMIIVLINATIAVRAEQRCAPFTFVVMCLLTKVGERSGTVHKTSVDMRSRLLCVQLNNTLG